MKLGNEEVEKGRLLADKAGESLNEIIKSAEQVVGIVSQVAAASQQQSTAAEQISKNVEAISNVSQQSAIGIQQIAKASEDLSTLTTNLQNLVQEFDIDNSSVMDRNFHSKTLSGLKSGNGKMKRLV
jgi:methyl-accepting chemotaxis protein